MTSSKWHATEEHSVDASREAVAQADLLITEVMRVRGYPMKDFVSVNRVVFPRRLEIENGADRDHGFYLMFSVAGHN